MTDRQLRKLKRVELLDMLIEQGKLVEAQNKEIENLKAQIENLNRQLKDTHLELEKCGSIAEASVRISGVFEAAQEAARIYLENLRDRSNEATGVDEAMKEAQKRLGQTGQEPGMAGQAEAEQAQTKPEPEMADRAAAEWGKVQEGPAEAMPGQEKAES